MKMSKEQLEYRFEDNANLPKDVMDSGRLIHGLGRQQRKEMSKITGPIFTVLTKGDDPGAIEFIITKGNEESFIHFPACSNTSFLEEIAGHINRVIVDRKRNPGGMDAHYKELMDKLNPPKKVKKGKNK